MTAAGPAPDRRAARGRRARPAAALLAAAVLAALPGCTSSSSDGAKPAPVADGSPAPVTLPPGPTATALGEVTVTGDVATGLDTPWGVAVLPDGDALVASRDTGTVSRIRPGTPGAVRVGNVPGVVHNGEGGLLGLALSPDFARDGLVYAYYTTAHDNRIARMRYTGDTLGAPEVLLSGIPAGSVHNGGRIAFGPDGMLYAGTGESGDKPLAQDPGSLGGKILRLTPDGAPAPGNPFPGSPVYSLGHRNVQGLAWDSGGRLWASEFGQNTWDELNLITPGANYGWPIVEGHAGDPRFVDPLAQWPVAEASPSGIAIVDDVIYVASLRGTRLWQVPIRGTTLGPATAYLQNAYGRLRTVLPAPGGGLWLTTSNTDGRGTPKPGDDRILHLKTT
ncbi:PQQ-dependent sugar dehydrogenase [Yinghuangia seranimata]|uniref:PQQ-dependent sugar dehydrogenase n=1 Tax=Yinghuangia seranimata TaxID=408067 RepID=UPI00248CFDA2|nr:PQQ-dependent sugar dehydrogenase [Yinghuangia seranimata]MDI2129351.1 PQQ-dependent sugar dehydrogenase [Yinghuangia seranimata]